MAVAEGLRRLTRIGLHKARVRMRQAQRQKVDFAFHPADDGQRFAKICLSMAGRMDQRDEHLPLTLSDAADVVLHNRNPAREAMLVTKALEDPLRRVTLLLRTVLILFQDPVDDIGKPALRTFAFTTSGTRMPATQ